MNTSSACVVLRNASAPTFGIRALSWSTSCAASFMRPVYREGISVALKVAVGSARQHGVLRCGAS